MRLLWLAVSRAWWTDPGPAARRILVAAARRLGGADHPDARARHLRVRRSGRPRGQCPTSAAGRSATRTLDTESVRHLGPAALVLGAFDIAVGFVPWRVGCRRSRRRGGAAACDRARRAALDRGRGETVLSPWSPAYEATPPPSAAPPAPSSWAWPPTARSPSPWPSSAGCSARWEREPARRRLRVGPAAIRPRRSGVLPGRGSLAHRRPRRGRPPHRPRRRGERAVHTRRGHGRRATRPSGSS